MGHRDTTPSHALTDYASNMLTRPTRRLRACHGKICVFAETEDFRIEFRRNTAGEVDGAAVPRTSGNIGQSATAHQVEPSLRIALSLQ